MNKEKMTSENTDNAGNFFDSTGSNSRNQSVPSCCQKSTQTVDTNYQCIVCTCSMSTPVEMHQHQITVHTVEELSLSILSLQLLYKMNKSFENEISTVNALNNNQSPKNNNNSDKFQRNSNMTVGDSNYKLQEEPICLKIHNRTSETTNTREDKKFKFQQKIAPKLQVKKPTLAVLKKIVPLRQEVSILPVAKNVPQSNSVQEIKIIQNDYLNKCSVPQIVSNQPLVWNDTQIFTYQNVPIIGNNVSQSQPTSSKMANNIVVDKKVYQNKVSGDVKKVEKFKTETLLKIPKIKCNPKVQEHQFKKPKSVLKNSKYSKKNTELNHKSRIIIQTPQTMANKIQETFNDSQIVVNYSPCVKYEETIQKAKAISPKPKEEPKPKEVFIKPKVISTIRLIETEPKEAKAKVIQDSRKQKVIPTQINQSSNPPEESSKAKAVNNPEVILKNQPTVIISRIDKIPEVKEETNNGAFKKNRVNIKKMENRELQLFDNFEIVNLKRKRSKSDNLKIVLSRSKVNPEFVTESSSKNSKVSKSKNPKTNKKSNNKKRKVSKLPEVPPPPFLPTKKSQSIEIIDDGWDNSVKEKLQVSNESPTDITKLAMQDAWIIPDFNEIQNDNICEDLTNENLIQMDPVLTSQLLQEYDFTCQGIDIEIFDDHQVEGNSLTGFTYENESEVLQVNQPTVINLPTSVDLNENLWSNENLTYAELLPVYQEDNLQDLN
ncbi:inner centromere protein A-like [Leptopilina heterotoma]|uniref:inner centromere protein A-like n=1 Tax=Leptopilina heterotoma TaxID=63436 RepID=UPI001CA810AE|nr:inner centromere protein A-like [Leptopilina heterotoma]